MYLIYLYYYNFNSNKEEDHCPCPLSELHPEEMVAYDISDVRDIILDNFYNIHVGEFKRQGKKDYILIESENETFDEFVLKLQNNENITIENVENSGEIEHDTLVFEYGYLIENDSDIDDIEYHIIYSATPISYSEKLRREFDDLREENDILLRRNAFLECEPFRGPEFFEALKEERDSGLLN